MSVFRPLLLERDVELQGLSDAFGDISGGIGRCVLIEGPAGTGKSALISTALELPEISGLQVLHARGSELEREFAFGVVRQLFEAMLTEAREPQRARLLAGSASTAERVILPRRERSAHAPEAGFATLHAIYWLAVNAAGEKPLLLVADDAHWADVSSLRALNHLAGWIGDTPIGLLAAMRPAEPEAPTQLLDELRSTPGSLHCALAPLSREAVARIVRESLPASGADVCDACSAVTAGNPLYLQELLRAVSANDAIGVSDPAVAVQEASAPSLGERVMRRIGRVAEGAPALAAAMAVLDDASRLSTAAALARISDQDAGRLAHQLRRIEILSSEDPFNFVHPLVRRSVYDSLSIAERNLLHTSAAALLHDAGMPVERVAAHLSAVPPSGSSSVARVLIEAAEEALARAAPDEAIRWFGRALEEGAPDPPPATIMAELGMTQLILRDREAIVHLEQALDLTEDPALKVRVAVALAEILSQAGEWERGMDVVAVARAELGDAQPELRAGLDAEVAAIRCALMAHDPAMIQDFDRERPRFTELAMGDSWASHALAALLAAMAAHRGEGVEKVLALAEQALAGGRLLSERGSGGWASIQVVSALAEIDEYERALAACEEVAAAGRRDGSLVGVITGLGGRGWIHARQGDLAAAEAELRAGLAMAHEVDMPMVDVSAVFYLQDAILERPSSEDLAEMAETIELDPGFAATWSGGMLLISRGRLRVARRDRQRGCEDLRRGLEIQEALHMGPAVSPARSALALALPDADRAEALSLVDEELALARASGLARPIGVALRAAGVLEGGEAGIEQLRESASLLEGSGARLEHARSLVELGAALRRNGRRSEARAPLALGMELADRCGAQRLVTLAREELTAAGGRPRRMATTGPAALTASERRVVEIAAQGASNPEIAQELFLSLKTIETHLSHAYSKLGIAGAGARDRLGKVLDEGPTAEPSPRTFRR